MNTINGFFRLAAASTGMLIVANALIVSAATTTVFVGAGGSDSFSPNIVNIANGLGSVVDRGQSRSM